MKKEWIFFKWHWENGQTLKKLTGPAKPFPVNLWINDLIAIVPMANYSLITTGFSVFLFQYNIHDIMVETSQLLYCYLCPIPRIIMFVSLFFFIYPHFLSDIKQLYSNLIYNFWI